MMLVMDRWPSSHDSAQVCNATPLTTLRPSRRLTIGVAVLCGLLMSLSVDTGLAQDAVPRVGRSNLAKAAMIHRYRATRDPGMLAEQLFVVNLHKQGVPHDDIVQRTIMKRQEWDRLRATAMSGDWEASERGKITARLLGRAATQLINFGGMGVEISNLGISFYESYMANRALPRAGQRLVETMRQQDDDFARPEAQVFALIEEEYANNSEFRRTWDVLFLPFYGFAPNASDQAVMERYPDFANNERIREVTRLVREDGDHTHELRKVTAEVWRGMTTLAETIRAEATSREAARRAEIEMAGYHAAGSLAAMAISFGNPQLARQIQVTNDVVFDVLDGVNTLEVARELGASTTLASLTLTADVVGGLIAIAGVLMDTGPTPDQIIISEIGRLREQVQEIRVEMHERFDGVHEHLDIIYQHVMDGFDVVLRDSRLNHQAVMDALDDSKMRLFDIAGVQLDLGSIVIDQLDLLEQLLQGFEFAPCLRSYDAAGEDAMRLSAYRDCRVNIEKVAPLLSQFQRDRILEPSRPMERPDRHVDWAFGEFKRLLSSTGSEGVSVAQSLPASVVGPITWFQVADAHDQLLFSHPEHAEADRNSAGASAELERFGQVMRIQQTNLVRYAHAIRGELRAFQEGRRATAFSQLLSTQWDSDRLETLLPDAPGRAMVDCYLDIGRVPPLPHCVNFDLGKYSADARRLLLESESFRQMARALEVGNVLLRSWLKLAFYDQIGRSKEVADLVSGRTGLPNLREIVERDGIGISDSFTWELVDEVRGQIELVEEALRTTAIREAIMAEYSHRILTGTVFSGF